MFFVQNILKKHGDAQTNDLPKICFFFSLFPQIFCITRKDELMKNCPKVNKYKREQIELIIGIPHEC